MADSWDDEDFKVPQFTKKVPKSWDDEEEEEEAPKPQGYQGPPKMTDEKARKKAAAEDARLAALVEAKLQADETPEERRVRERQQVEDADHELTEDLFGGGGCSVGEEGDAGAARGNGAAVAGAAVGGAAGATAVEATLETIKLKSLQDHMKVAITLGGRMSKSKSNAVVAFLKEALNQVEKTLSEEELAEVVAHCTKLKEAKAAARARAATKKADAPKAAGGGGKKKGTAAKKMHAETFGDVEDNAIDSMGMAYEDQYDDFM